MRYYIPIPDNSDAFYAYVNLVINNKHNANIPEDIQSRPAKIGWVKPLTYTHNEVGEPFVVCQTNKEKVFVEMIIDQFHLLRSHWNMIQSLVRYENSSRY